MAKRRSPAGKPGPRPVTVGFVSLGCAKNLVDLQVMAGELVHAGIVLAGSPDDADIILVNTCAFIEDAREEAASEILWACERKQAGQCKAVIVTGCLPQRYRGRMLRAFPGVDAILGVDDLDRVATVVQELAAGVRGVDAVSNGAPHRVFTPRRADLVLTGGPFAYLKIGEGCNHACAFCAIPGIRGRYRSRPMPDLVDEARSLLKAGFREINLISQDITSYGKDLDDGTDLVALLRALDALDGEYWLRLLYGYPVGVSDELLAWMAASRHACRYLDIPVQHSHPDILKAMRRAETVPHVATLVGRLRAAVPGITLRTTFLVGFPGETEDHFRHLLDYAAAARFDHVGVFAYSPEEGTAAFAMAEEPDDVTAERRRDTLMRQQAALVNERLTRLHGKEDVVLLEQRHMDEDGNETPWWAARSASQAPEELDGITLVADVPAEAVPGQFARVRYTGHTDYDAEATYLGLHA
jgi:ribosomal protein S12 methylthiotransferase